MHRGVSVMQSVSRSISQSIVSRQSVVKKSVSQSVSQQATDRRKPTSLHLLLRPHLMDGPLLIFSCAILLEKKSHRPTLWYLSKILVKIRPDVFFFLGVPRQLSSQDLHPTVNQ